MINSETRSEIRSEITDITYSQVSDSCIKSHIRDDTHGSKRSWIKRTFGPMHKGSVRSSIITLMSCAMGSGLLAFPCKYLN